MCEAIATDIVKMIPTLKFELQADLFFDLRGEFASRAHQLSAAVAAAQFLQNEHSSYAEVFQQGSFIR